MKLPQVTTLIIALLLTASWVAAQDKTTLPIPPRIMEAKRIFLVNTAGHPELFDLFCSEMKTWNRYEIVNAPDKAELIFEFSFWSDNEVDLRPDSYSFDLVKVSVMQSHTPLWSIAHPANDSTRKDQQEAVRQVLSALKRRLGDGSRDLTSSPQETAGLTNTLDVKIGKIEADAAQTGPNIRTLPGRGGSRVIIDKQGRSVKLPQFTAKPEPQYTEEARQAQVVGTVVLSAMFLETGEVTDIQVVAGLPNGLTERAIAAAKLIKFISAETGGKKIPYRLQVEYNFNLY